MSLLPEINQASAEINKFVAQANIHQTIAPVNPAEFTSPADTLLLASRDPVIREVSVGMTGVEGASYTVSGTPPLSLPNSLGEPLKAWEVDVLPYQEGTGDPAPDNVRPIHGTDKLNLFVEESYDQSAAPKAVLTLPQTVYTGTIGSEGGESRSVLWTANTSTMNNGEDYPGWRLSGIREILGSGRSDHLVNQRLNIGNAFNINTVGTNDILFLSKSDYHLTQSEWKAMAVDVQIEVILPTSTQFSLTAPPIPTPTGTATTWATAEDGTVESMEVTYVGKA